MDGGGSLSERRFLLRSPCRSRHLSSQPAILFWLPDRGQDGLSLPHTFIATKDGFQVCFLPSFGLRSCLERTSHLDKPLASPWSSPGHDRTALSMHLAHRYQAPTEYHQENLCADPQPPAVTDGRVTRCSIPIAQPRGPGQNLPNLRTCVIGSDATRMRYTCAIYNRSLPACCQNWSRSTHLNRSTRVRARSFRQRVRTP
ncbi:hypothetical protein PLICRDRAFT_209003 [Plicaturopsis crispa FD-325 SS-3]|nr:hypothetical protein PLICRDRAFT_209003 [Plicaturopsis crispa FD-325 SS-3]